MCYTLEVVCTLLVAVTWAASFREEISSRWCDLKTGLAFAGPGPKLVPWICIVSRCVSVPSKSSQTGIQAIGFSLQQGRGFRVGSGSWIRPDPGYRFIGRLLLRGVSGCKSVIPRRSFWIEFKKTNPGTRAGFEDHWA